MTTIKKIMMIGICTLSVASSNERVSVYEMSFKEANMPPKELDAYIANRNPVKVYEKSKDGKTKKILKMGCIEVIIYDNAQEELAVKNMLLIVSKYAKKSSLENSEAISKITAELGRHIK